MRAQELFPGRGKKEFSCYRIILLDWVTFFISNEKVGYVALKFSKMDKNHLLYTAQLERWSKSKLTVG